VKKQVTFIAYCECGWHSDPQTSCSKAQAAVKKHTDDSPHRDFDDVPMF